MPRAPALSGQQHVKRDQYSFQKETYVYFKKRPINMTNQSASGAWHKWTLACQKRPIHLSKRDLRIFQKETYKKHPNTCQHETNERPIRFQTETYTHSKQRPVDQKYLGHLHLKDNGMWKKANTHSEKKPMQQTHTYDKTRLMKDQWHSKKRL